MRASLLRAGQSWLDVRQPAGDCPRRDFRPGAPAPPRSGDRRPAPRYGGIGASMTHPACPDATDAPAPGLSRKLSRGVLRLGLWRSTALLTLAVWVLALIAAQLMISLLGRGDRVVALASASALSLLLAPLPGLLLLRLVFELELARQRIAMLTTRDPLTGLAHRCHFLDAAGREWERARRYGNDAALLLIDVDRFHRVNDEHGHLCGDELLRRIAAAAAASLRQPDLRGALRQRGADRLPAADRPARRARRGRAHPRARAGAAPALAGRRGRHDGQHRRRPAALRPALARRDDPRVRHRAARRQDRRPQLRAHAAATRADSATGRAPADRAAARRPSPTRANAEGPAPAGTSAACKAGACGRIRGGCRTASAGPQPQPSRSGAAYPVISR